MAQIDLIPNVNGTYTNWYVYPTKPLESYFTYVDDPPASPDDDTTYHWETSYGDLSELNITDDPVLDGSTINWVRVYIRHRATTSPPGTGHIDVGLRLGGTRYSNGTVTCAIVYQTHYKEWTTNPATSNPWQASDIDDLQISFMHNYILGGLEFRVTQVYVKVDYTPPAAGQPMAHRRGTHIINNKPMRGSF